MTTQAQIDAYIASLPQAKQSDLQELQRIILGVMPKAKLWFLDGKNDAGKVVSNPNIGYGQYTMTYADGKTREFYQIGLSANTSGISVYIMGPDDKNYLPATYGKALGKAIESYPEDLKVVVFGTGGMSHQLQGERAGFINKPFDTMFMQKLVEDPQTLSRLSNAELVEQAGSEGVELIMWLAMRGAMTRGASVVHSHYHIPVSNTAAGVLVLENMAPVLAAV